MHTKEQKREYMRRYMREQRARMKGEQLSAGDARHGTPHAYRNLSCRCIPCTKAVTFDMRDYRERNRAT
jgi:hypothetical protein